MPWSGGDGTDGWGGGQASEGGGEKWWGALEVEEGVGLWQLVCGAVMAGGGVVVG